MNINGVHIEDTFAEAFGMRGTRLLITGENLKWAYHGATALTGFATSVIACGAEAGIERKLDPSETPDGRPGASVLMFATSSKELAAQVERRVGQTILTCPTASCFSGLSEGDPIALGKNLRYFGDGWQASKVVDGRRFWRVPVMDGEFVCEETTRMVRAVGGGNFLILTRNSQDALAAAEAAIEAKRKVPNVIMPFPGGVVRSGSKVGSRYKTLPASTNDAFCPTLRGVVKSDLPDEAGCCLEIVIDGLTADDITIAMRVGMQAVCARGRDQGVIALSAGNYGGKLGQFHFKLREILAVGGVQ
jgi:formylmethanofuran--tetrahydromethanopterin N-formyltransferase